MASVLTANTVLLFAGANVAVAILLRWFDVKLYSRKFRLYEVAFFTAVILALPTVGMFWLALDFLNSNFLEEFRVVLNDARLAGCAMLAIAIHMLVIFLWERK